MSKIVFILGAGASAHCGTPLMKDFLQRAEDLRREGQAKAIEADFARVHAAHGELHAIHSKTNLPIDNIETLFTAVHMGEVLGRFPGTGSRSEVSALIRSVEKVICCTLECTTQMPHDGNLGIVPPRHYAHFAGIVSSLIEQDPKCSIMTFNYDLGLDYSLYAARILPDYGLGDAELRGRKQVPVLKLHGSINFAKCSRCADVVIPDRDFGTTDFESGKDYNVLRIASKLHRLKCKKCGQAMDDEPLVVPPTWNKTAGTLRIRPVWERAAQELTDAEEIFVLGYSLPASDWFFQYLIALGVDYRTSMRGFYVYNRNKEVDGRFKGLLGPDLLDKYEFYPITFEKAVQYRLEDSEGSNLKTIPQILHINAPPIKEPRIQYTNRGV